MADPRRVAAALAYQQGQQDPFDAVPVADAPGTVRAPQTLPMTFMDRLNNLSAGLGTGITNQLEGYRQMITDPIQSAKDIGTAAVTAVRNPSVIVDALKGMGERAASGSQGLGEVLGENMTLNPRKLAMALTHPKVAEMTVYHGTPHRFPATEANPLGEFDASKIGTGEGAQAYGHGIYVAESPDVAGKYKSTLTQSVSSGAQRRLDQAGGDIDKAIKEATAKAEKYRTGGAKSYADSVEEDLRGLKQFKESGKWSEGSLYHVDLPDPMIEKMLDWDKPLSEQPKVVREALAMIDPDTWHPSGNDFDANELGQSIYNRLMHQSRDFGIESGKSANTTLHGAQAKASEDLRAFGIPGIRYLDEGSRGNGSIFKKFASKQEAEDFAKKAGGTTQVQPRQDQWVVVGEPNKTRNFVIFPGEEKNLKILERK